MEPILCFVSHKDLCIINPIILIRTNTFRIGLVIYLAINFLAPLHSIAQDSNFYKIINTMLPPYQSVCDQYLFIETEPLFYDSKDILFVNRRLSEVCDTALFDLYKAQNVFKIDSNRIEKKLFYIEHFPKWKYYYQWVTTTKRGKNGKMKKFTKEIKPKCYNSYSVSNPYYSVDKKYCVIRLSDVQGSTMGYNSILLFKLDSEKWIQVETLYNQFY